MVVGIVCEFNPFHKGHQYLLDTIRQMGADTVVCAMSGNFVQRGDAAIADKLIRAETAVRCGADLVLELPTPWAMATAETFAKGGVELLAMARCDTIAFGSECGDLDALQAVTDVLCGDNIMSTIKRHLESGVTYARARQLAVAEQLGEKAQLLESPNNTLAVEYLKALRKLEVDIKCITIPRIGGAHDGEAVGDIASASYLRKLIKSGENVEKFMPSAAAEVLQKAAEQGSYPVDITLCERAILARLRSMAEDDFAAYDPGGEGLYHRLYDAVRQATTLDEVLTLAKTKRYPMARLRRMVLAAWLGLDSVPEKVPYLRVLAANEQGRKHLRVLQDSGAPVLTKPADVGKLGLDAEKLFREECARTDLYTLCKPKPLPVGSDWRLTPKMR